MPNHASGRVVQATDFANGQIILRSDIFKKPKCHINHRIGASRILSPQLAGDKRNAAPLNTKTAGGVSYKSHLSLSRTSLDTPLKFLLLEVAQGQMRLQMSHIFKLSDRALCLAPPFGGLRVRYMLRFDYCYDEALPSVCVSGTRADYA